MIIDSHAHYSHRLYQGEFPCLTLGKDDFVLTRVDRAGLVAAMRGSNIGLAIEPATGLDRIPDQLALAAAHPDFFRLAFGLHPKKCAETPWEDREKLRSLVMEHDIVAIGETGLDYSVLPEELDKECQKMWFVYQIELAHEKGLPLILHIRDAHADALQILRQYRHLLHGGVTHCFGGDYETAMAYIELGFAIGIGGRVLNPEETALRSAVARVPLSALLVETDAPYIRPDIRHLPVSGKERKKARNTSLILPMVIREIARLRDTTDERIEEATCRNALEIFRLDIHT
jgi:TatD DNase family protein